MGSMCINRMTMLSTGCSTAEVHVGQIFHLVEGLAFSGLQHGLSLSHLRHLVLDNLLDAEQFLRLQRRIEAPHLRGAEHF